MSDEGGGSSGVPEWVVTFGDMMSLLLTFFIMLVSFSELKSEEKYQALVDAFQQQFGYQASRLSMVPGDLRPRNSALTKLATAGRAKRLDIMQGGAKTKSTSGDSDRVQMIRPGQHAGIGTVLYFQEEQVELSPEQQDVLRQLADVIQGKPQKVEIRGHTSSRPIQSGSSVRDHWDLGYERCRQVMQYLVNEVKLDIRRIRLSTVAANEPQYVGTDIHRLQRNPRVEIYVLDEIVSETVGTETERDGRFSAGPSATIEGQ